MKVAVVGMACLFPGAPNLDTFLRNLRDGVDAITDVPAARVDPAFFGAGSAGDRFYCRRGGFVDAFATFEATSFGIMPVAAKGAEPDQLLTLQVAAAALADAGYADRPFARDRAAVILGRGGYAGAGHTRLEEHVRTAEQILVALRALLPDVDEATLARVKREFQAGLGAPGPDAVIGLVPNLAASRIAQRLDLRGPAFTIDAACASSLIAVGDACRELESGRVDLALAGGVHLSQDEAFWSVFSQLGAVSRSSCMRPFDRRADGLLMGEGVGIVVLKRLEDAERDGDRVYAVIRGFGTASDGRGATLMSPSADGQVLALERAWQDSGLDRATVGLMEAHGTGTPAGDAAELTTLARVFGPPQNTTRDATGAASRAVLGSVKSMIGHTMPAAGAAGLIKAVLAVHHGLRFPTLHCEEPTPLLASTRFRVIDHVEPWEEAGPRRAGVNAFGFGGINAHVVVEQHASATTPRALSVTNTNEERFSAFSAKDVESLSADVIARNERSDGGSARLLVFDPSPERLEKARTIALRGKPWRGRDGIWFSPEGLLSQGGTIAFVFPGVDASFEPRVDDVARHFGRPSPAHLEDRSIERVGMAIIEVNRLLDDVLRSLGIVPANIAGHSIGEWSGMVSSGILPEAVLEEVMAALRGGSLEVPGVVFAAAGCGVAQAEKAMEGLPSIALSHDNCPHQVILCGRSESVDVALSRLREDGVLAQKLPFQSGFHSPLFADYLGPHRENFDKLALEAPRTPLWSATTCAPFPKDAASIRTIAIDHLVKPVRFREVVEALYAEGARVFVQVGTGSLVNFVEDTLRGRPHFAMSANVKDRSGMDQLRRLLAALYVEGANVDPSRVAKKSGPSMTLALGVPLVRSFTPLPRPSTVESAASIALHGPLAVDFTEVLADITEAQRAVLDRFTTRATNPSAAASRAPREETTTRTFSLDAMPELIDHSFFRQPPGWKNVSDRHPVVPMTTSIDFMLAYAEAFVPGLVAVALEDFRAYRWLVVSTPVHVPVTCRFDGDRRVHVRIGDYNEGTVVLAERYPDAPPADTSPLAEAAPAPHDAQTMYDERWMFHGPAFQGVVDTGLVGKDAIRGTIRTPAARGALLDNAGQLFGYWVMIKHTNDRMAMPVRVMKLEIFGPHPRAGDDLECTVHVRSVGDKSVVADLSLAKDGRTWARIEGWEDRRFETNPRLWSVMLFPEDNLLAEPQDEGFVLLDDRYGAATTRDQLARRFLGEAERRDYEAQGPRKQRSFLAGRIAAKDALRDLLWKSARKPIFPVEFAIHNDAAGRPIVQSLLADDLRVSIAHKDGIAVALARRGRPVGIDVEHIEPRTASFAELSFDDAELRLVADRSKDEGYTYLWAVKEAAAKALGDGLAGNPRRFVVRDRAGHRFLVGEQWIGTKRHHDHVIAWTET